MFRGIKTGLHTFSIAGEHFVVPQSFLIYMFNWKKIRFTFIHTYTLFAWPFHNTHINTAIKSPKSKHPGLYFFSYMYVTHIILKVP